MQEPCGVMVGLAENIQACLRIFRRAQHQWLVRDILHLPQGVFIVFVLHPPHDPQDRLRLIRPIRLIRGRIESTGQGFLRFLSYDQPRTGHKSVPAVAEQLSIERVLISVLSCFFILYYTAKMSI